MQGFALQPQLPVHGEFVEQGQLGGANIAIGDDGQGHDAGGGSAGCWVHIGA
jgi:hypothetical protein